MTKILSFNVAGDYASFRDPSVTSNQTVYYIPSKTAVVGILGAILGIKRSNRIDEMYSTKFLEFFSKISIGLQVQNNPRKITYFTNHRSLKEPKTKPVKKELLENPQYMVYVQSSDNKILDRIYDVIKGKKYHFSPYLGHAYCHAKLENPLFCEGEKVKEITGEETRCVVLDETETYNEKFQIDMSVVTDVGTIIIERHLHHFIKENKLQRRVLKHWIPLESTVCELTKIRENTLSEFYKIKDDGRVVCLY